MLLCSFTWFPELCSSPSAVCGEWSICSCGWNITLQHETAAVWSQRSVRWHRPRCPWAWASLPDAVSLSSSPALIFTSPGTVGLGRQPAGGISLGLQQRRWEHSKMWYQRHKGLWGGGGSSWGSEIYSTSPPTAALTYSNPSNVSSRDDHVWMSTGISKSLYVCLCDTVVQAHTSLDIFKILLQLLCVWVCVLQENTD